MTGLIFLAMVLTLFLTLIGMLLNVFRKRPIKAQIKRFLIILAAYAACWGVFYALSKDQPIPLGTDICFDDWCATVTQFEKFEPKNASPKQPLIVLHLRMSNHAKGIAQKPSEPKVHIEDAQGNVYLVSKKDQQALETERGQQIPLDARLELHQSLETQLVFAVPAEAKELKAVIEEGPWIINRLIFNSNRKVYLLKYE